MTPDDRREAIERALGFVPLNLYDEVTKLAEQAFDETAADLAKAHQQNDRLKEQLEGARREVRRLYWQIGAAP